MRIIRPRGAEDGRRSLALCLANLAQIASRNSNRWKTVKSDVSNNDATDTSGGAGKAAAP